jgi:RimJ/RimL family protein N-acetyltransferase
MLQGTRVRLRAVEPADYALLHSWLNDPEVMVYWGRPGNTQSLAEVSANEEAQARRGTSRKYIIETLDGEPIGQIDYYDLDMVSRTAWTSIMIAKPDHWGGGYGTDAMRALLRYLFNELGLRRVTLTAIEENERARKSYLKNGFVQEGVLRDFMFFDGAQRNSVIMGVLADDFRAIMEKQT